MSDDQLKRTVDTVVRSLATAAKTLRLYPPTSPIPRQTADAAIEALGSFFIDEPSLPLAVAREGFSFHSGVVNAPGSAELGDLLTQHGIAEIEILPGATVDDLIAFISIVLRDPITVRNDGGMGAALVASGVASVHVSDVALSVADLAELDQGDDVDEFLRELASDPEKLAVWLATAANGDPAALAEGLAELQSVVGSAGLDTLVTSLSAAFLKQQPDAKDAIMGLSAKNQDLRGLMASVFGSIGSPDIAQSLAGGLFGKNVLSMSNMLATLPIGSRVSEILAEVKPMLAAAGHTAREMAYLEHMLELREKEGREAPIIEQRPDYEKVARIVDVKPEEVQQVRKEVQTSVSKMNARSVTTMLQLLDQQEDFSLYCKTLDGLASTVPALFEMRDFALADQVLGELTSREARTDQAWPELTEKIRAAIAKATGARSMAALLYAVDDDAALIPAARDILRHTGSSAQTAFLHEALGTRNTEILNIAGEVLGRRMLDLLITELPHVEWSSIAPIVERLAAEGDPRSNQAIDAVLRRPDDQSRQEAAKGLANTDTPMAIRQLASLVRDPSLEVSLVAIRSAGRSVAPGAVTMLGAHFDELDCDNKDFTACREIINALTYSPHPDATAVLSRIAGRKALIKRGHFAEISDLARHALTTREKEGER
ncbi:MAG: hypothetical protein CVT66_09020 [Actinobacteria bacterium HGW-Actinobacteria-6]|nr:MAG: hypothetical protein CVT66_09020 [Actinobacteria bacterium HGW-Actinobacteria-6]